METYKCVDCEDEFESKDEEYAKCEICGKQVCDDCIDDHICETEE